MDSSRAGAHHLLEHFDGVDAIPDNGTSLGGFVERAHGKGDARRRELAFEKDDFRRES